MKRHRTSVVFGIACVALLVAGRLATAAAPSCGDGREDPGEQCDHGKYNGISCCDAQCRWIPENHACVPAPFDPCKQGRCDAEHICVVATGTPAGYIDPCAAGTTCRGCVATGKGPGDFACTGPPSADGSACADDEGADRLCTLDVCKGGECTHAPKECPSDGACDPKTGRCEAKTVAAPPGHQSRRD